MDSDRVAQGAERRGTPLQFKLSKPEMWWHERYEWFRGCGYILRSRYSPDWTPSWLETSKRRWACEDDRPVEFAARLLDATRISDGAHVYLELVDQSVHPFEVEIGRYFSSVATDNYCVPIYDVHQVPEDNETVIIVTPLLSEYMSVPFQTVGEAVECFRQLLEGTLFMHKHHVAHRDCTSRNVMMHPTAIYIDAFHPVNPRKKRDFSGPVRFRTRTEARPKYIFIDLGISRRYDPSVVEPKEDPIWGADKTVPEFQNSNEPRDPFPTDVYYIGNMIKNDFLKVTRGLEFTDPLLVDMVQEDPSERPTMQEVVNRFRVIQAGVCTWKLRSCLVDNGESLIDKFLYDVLHWMRRIKYMTKGIPSVPAPLS